MKMRFVKDYLYGSKDCSIELVYSLDVIILCCFEEFLNFLRI